MLEIYYTDDSGWQKQHRKNILLLSQLESFKKLKFNSDSLEFEEKELHLLSVGV